MTPVQLYHEILKAMNDKEFIEKIQQVKKEWYRRNRECDGKFYEKI